MVKERKNANLVNSVACLLVRHLQNYFVTFDFFLFDKGSTKNIFPLKKKLRKKGQFRKKDLHQTH